MKKQISDYVWPVENYTDKIHSGIRAIFQLRPWLSFTIPQMREAVVRGYSWLANPTERQTILLDKLIKTGIQKLIQSGKVKKVLSVVSIEGQWQWASSVSDSGYINVTSEDSVARSEAAQKAIGRRALGGQTLWRLNNMPTMSMA